MSNGDLLWVAIVGMALTTGLFYTLTRKSKE